MANLDHWMKRDPDPDPMTRQKKKKKRIARYC
jgi:hypothetical protein